MDKDNMLMNFQGHIIEMAWPHTAFSKTLEDYFQQKRGKLISRGATQSGNEARISRQYILKIQAEPNIASYSRSITLPSRRDSSKNASINWSYGDFMPEEFCWDDEGAIISPQTLEGKLLDECVGRQKIDIIIPEKDRSYNFVIDIVKCPGGESNKYSWAIKMDEYRSGNSLFWHKKGLGGATKAFLVQNSIMAEKLPTQLNTGISGWLCQQVYDLMAYKSVKSKK